MISRRTLLGTVAGAVAVGGALAGTAALGGIDEVAEALGIEPRPRPDARDEALLAAVAGDQKRLLDLVSATADRYPELTLAPFAAIAAAQLDGVGGSDLPATEVVVPDTAPAAVADLAARWDAAASARADDSVTAVTTELALVLASMSAGAAQCAQQLREPA